MLEHNGSAEASVDQDDDHEEMTLDLISLIDKKNAS